MTFEADRALLSKMREFSEMLETYGAWKLDPNEPLRQLWRDVDYATEHVAASLRGAERRIEHRSADADLRPGSKGGSRKSKPCSVG